MGVRYLQTFLETHCTGASYYVNIVELLKRQNFGDREPIIVVDGSSCIRILYKNLEWIGGGQLKQFGDEAKHFVDAFREIGVRLVFFFDGPTEGRKRRTWIQRRLQRLKRVKYVLDAISRGQRHNQIDRKQHFLLPPGLGQLSRVIFEIVCGCEVYQSIMECDEEIAEYARTHRAFAILSQDSDYVILDKGGALYLSMENLNLETMETRHYDSRALANRLGIHVSQLPLWATLLGNDIIPYDDLKRFHNRISKGNSDCSTLFPIIATYISTLPRNESLLLPKLPEISQRVFGNPSRHKEILTSIRSYSSSPSRDHERMDRARNSHWAKLLEEARGKHRRNEMPGMIYAIMKGLPFESSNIMEDYRKDDLPLFATATEPIRKRLYGILLQEKPLLAGEQHSIEEWCVAGPNSLDEPVFVTAELPVVRHPGLRALWGRDRKWLTKRWELFAHSVSRSIPVHQLRSIPPYLVIPTMIVFYIFDHLYTWEMDAILATAAVIKHYDTARLAAVPADPMLPRGIRLSSLYMRITFIIYILLAACGYPLSQRETAPWNFFDGKLFQAKYRAAKDGASHARLCEHRADVLEHFQMARTLLEE